MVERRFAKTIQRTAKAVQKAGRALGHHSSMSDAAIELSAEKIAGHDSATRYACADSGSFLAIHCGRLSSHGRSGRGQQRPWNADGEEVLHLTPHWRVSNTETDERGTDVLPLSTSPRLEVFVTLTIRACGSTLTTSP